MCQLNYSHILHYENLAEEWPQFLADVGVQEKIELPWQNKGNSNSRSNSAKEYFRPVAQRDISQLAHKYRSDFQMFGYSVEEF